MSKIQNLAYRRHFKMYYSMIHEKELIKREMNVLYGRCDIRNMETPLAKRWHFLAARLDHIAIMLSANKT